MFIRDSQELADSEVDDVIDINFEDDLETMIRYAVKELTNVLDLPEPSPEKIEEGLEKAKAYTAKSEPQKAKKKEKEFAPRYFALLPEVDIKDLVNAQLEKPEGITESCRQFWDELKTTDKVMYHITIVHKASLPQEAELWERCAEVFRLAKPPLFNFKITNLVWNDRVMALTAEDLGLDTPDDEQRGAEFVSKLAPEIRNRLHITLGTRNSAKPVEALSMVEKWRVGGDEGTTHSIKLDATLVKGMLKGLQG
jgi:tRNA ligase